MFISGNVFYSSKINQAGLQPGLVIDSVLKKAESAMNVVLLLRYFP
jgi:hypothetical protein